MIMYPHVDERDKGWSWIVVTGCFVINFTTVGFLKSSSVLYVSLMDILRLSGEQASWPIFLMASLLQLSGPIFSCLVSYLTFRKWMMIGSLLSTFGFIFCYLSTGYFSLIINVGIINGIGSGLMYTLNPIVISLYFNKFRTIAMGIFTSGAVLGALTLPLLIEFLIENYDLKGFFLLIGGVMLQNIVAACLYRQPINPTFKKDFVQEENKGILWKAFEVMKDPLFHVTAITYAIFFFFSNIFITVIIDFAVERKIEKVKALLIVSAFNFSDLFGRFFCSWIVDLKFVKRVTITSISFFCMGSLLAVLLFIKNYSIIMSISVVLGFLSGCTIIHQYLFLLEHLGMKNLPVSIGLCNLNTGLFTLINAPVIGYFKDRFGKYESLFYLIAFLLIFSSIVWILEPLFRKCRKVISK